MHADQRTDLANVTNLIRKILTVLEVCGETIIEVGTLKAQAKEIASPRSTWIERQILSY